MYLFHRMKNPRGRNEFDTGVKVGSDTFGTDDRGVMKPKDFVVSHDLKVGTIVGTNRST
jgi:hypothetical protein